MIQNSVDEKDKGEVGVGDRHGLKKSMIETYLKDAFQTGNVSLLDKCRVNHVLHTSKNEQQRIVKGVSCQMVSDESSFDLLASVVVISGGSINSPAILMRTENISSECNFNESGMLGQNLRLHPVVGIMGVVPYVVDIWNGAPMTTVSEEVAHSSLDGSHYGAKIEVSKTCCLFFYNVSLYPFLKMLYLLPFSSKGTKCLTGICKWSIALVKSYSVQRIIIGYEKSLCIYRVRAR